MLALVGDIGEPLPHLTVGIMQISELAQRPEILAHISDGTFDFAFGEKRALQTVPTVDYKFSLSRIRSIH
jgi:hypothetical protein